MFGFLKDKLKKAVGVFTKATTEEVKEEPKPVEKPAPKKEEKKPVAKAVPKKEEKKPVKEEKKVTQQPQKPVKKETVLEQPKQKEPVEEKHKPVEKHIPVQAVAAPTPLQEEIIVEEITQKEEPKKQGFFSKVFGGKKEEKKTEPVVIEEKPAVIEKKPEPEKSEGVFSRLKAAVTTKKISHEEFENIFQELEIDLLENNVALEVVDKIKADLWEALSTERFNRFSPEKRVQQALMESIEGLFMDPFDILKEAKSKEIYIICAVGINGSGKTTTLAKLAHYFKEHKLEPVLAAGDTFRAAAIQQLEEHANKIGVKIIKQQYGADAAAVAFDAIQYAKANKARVVLIDTAGRLHSNTNLMEELKKIVRVAKPDRTLFIGEATTGNDCVEQAVQFQQAVNVDGIVLSKVDVDERGGAALSISYVTKKPIIFFGTGQTYDDLQPFDKTIVVQQLNAEE
jgi:fused signal recognition particle receptor